MKPQCAPFAVSRGSQKVLLSQEVHSSGSCVTRNTFVDRGFSKYVSSGFENSCDVVLDSGLCRETDAGFEITNDVFLISGLRKMGDAGFETKCDLFLYSGLRKRPNSDIRIPAQTKENPVTRTGLGGYEMQRTRSDLLDAGGAVYCSAFESL